jgi:hypothetical protein
MISFDQQTDRLRESQEVENDLTTVIDWNSVTENSALFDMEYLGEVYSGKMMWEGGRARLISCTRGMPENARYEVIVAFENLELLTPIEEEEQVI